MRHLFRSAVLGSCLAILFCVVLGAGAAGPGPADAKTGSPEMGAKELVHRAYERMFNYPSVRHVRMRVRRNGRLVSIRAFDIAFRTVEGRGRSLLRFTDPEYLRGDGLLVIEAGDGTSEAWLYLREAGRPRRVGTHQKGDAFYGTDVTFEDLEHKSGERFSFKRLDDVSEGGNRFFRVEAEPPSDSQYSKLVLWIERERLALARIECYRGASGELLKTLRIPLDEIVEEDGLLKPRRMIVERSGRDGSTEVEFARLEIEPDISPRVLSIEQLQRPSESLFDLVSRHTEPEPAPAPEPKPPE